MRHKSNFENRSNIRVLPQEKFPIRVDINGENFVDICFAKNISMGGVGIVVPHKFKDCEINMNVTLIVNIPHPINKNITFSNSIVHIDSHAFGIAFNKLLKQEKKDLKKYILYLLGDCSSIKRLLFKSGFI